MGDPPLQSTSASILNIQGAAQTPVFQIPPTPPPSELSKMPFLPLSPRSFLCDIYYHLKFLFKDLEVLIVSGHAGVPPLSQAS